METATLTYEHGFEKGLALIAQGEMNTSHYFDDYYHHGIQAGIEQAQAEIEEDRWRQMEDL